MTDEVPDNGGDIPALSTELQQFAADLSRLQPRDDRLDRERLAFLAGQASMVNAPSRTDQASGLRLENRVWPAAFAAMSALAATLFFLLITRPDLPIEQGVATSRRIPINQDIAGDDRNFNRDVLTTQDARAGDLEARFAKLDAEQTEAGVPTHIDDRTAPVFTPTAWRQAIQEMDSPKPLQRKSSNVLYNRGIDT